MPLDHGGEVLVGFQALPLELRPPVLDELSGPHFAVVVPQLTEGIFEQVRGVEALVGRQQQLEIRSCCAGKVLWMRQQGVFLSLDELAFLALEARVLRLSDLVQRLAQMFYNVELIEQDGRLRGVTLGRVTKRLPHVRDGQAHALSLLFPEKSIELIHARFAAILTTEPDRAAPFQVADHDAIGVAFADRDIINLNDLGSRSTYAADLFTHMVHFQPLDRLPVHVQLVGHVLGRAAAAVTTTVDRFVFVGTERIASHRPALRSFLIHWYASKQPVPPAIVHQRLLQSRRFLQSLQPQLSLSLPILAHHAAVLRC